MQDQGRDFLGCGISSENWNKHDKLTDKQTAEILAFFGRPRRLGAVLGEARGTWQGNRIK